jgi:hypothetical protein
MGEAFEEIGDQWRDDAFDRKSYATYLTAYLRGKVLGAGPVPMIRPFTMALDADWGSGKTFFIQRWSQDLRTSTGEVPGHTVVTFDAWAADYAADPLVAFMSELRSELQRAVKEGGLVPTARRKASKAITEATKSVRKLALPLAGIVAKSVFKKVSGVDLAEVAETWTSDDATSTSTPQHDPVKLEKFVSTTQADAVLDKLFTVQMSEHAKRKQSIEDFKRELGTVLAVLGSREGYSAPLFIVIDELDRCKPSFAVGLLEAVKHIFGVPGVCVVIATNMDQLAHTVKAVYGEGFDARTYLQRFFDAIYALPTATGPRLLEVMLKERLIFSDQRRCKWAMPRSDFMKDAYGTQMVGVLAWIFDGLRLDLRSQGQVLEIMEAAAFGIQNDRAIHVAWLAIVCGLWHSHRVSFHEVETLSRTGSNADEVWKTLGFDGVRRRYFQASAHPGSANDQVVSLRDLGAAYCSKANQNLTGLNARLNNESRGFSSLVERELAVDAPHSYNPTTHYSSGLIEYFELARTAGHFEVSKSA